MNDTVINSPAHSFDIVYIGLIFILPVLLSCMALCLCLYSDQKSKYKKRQAEYIKEDQEQIQKICDQAFAKHMISKIAYRDNMSIDESEKLMDCIIVGNLTDSQISAILIGLRMKGESSSELIGFIKSVRKHETVIQNENENDNVIDVVGTGGDGKNSINVSTIVAFVISTCGLKVVKHCNNAVSGMYGSVDLISDLGINLYMTPKQMFKCLSSGNLLFLYAKRVHNFMKYVNGPRVEIGIRTVFNILGPFINPVRPQHQLIGVYDKNILPILTEVVLYFGTKHTILLNSDTGMDEFNISGQTYIVDIKDNTATSYILRPSDLNIPEHPESEIICSNPQDNIDNALKILKGDSTGALKDVIIANSALALYVSDTVSTIIDAVPIARKCLESNRPYEKLIEITKLSKEQ